MGKKANIATWAMNKNAIRGKTQGELLELAEQKLNSLAGYRLDLILLPEVFLESGGDDQNPNWAQNNEAALLMLKEKAKAFHCYIAAGIQAPVPRHPDKKHIVGILIGRDGEEIGRYLKNHTVYEESTVHGAVPGSQIPVFDTDFGRIGMQICFDIGWRDGWHELAKKGAKLVIWLSDYDGGGLLNAHAAHCMYYVASSVRSDHARIIDFLGHTIAQSSSWNGLAMATIDLETELFHTDRQAQKMDEIRARLGEKVTICSHSQEHVFTIESNSGDWPMQRIIDEFGLMTYRDYHAEAEALQQKWRTQYGGK